MSVENTSIRWWERNAIEHVNMIGKHSTIPTFVADSHLPRLLMDEMVKWIDADLRQYHLAYYNVYFSACQGKLRIELISFDRDFKGDVGKFTKWIACELTPLDELAYKWYQGGRVTLLRGLSTRLWIKRFTEAEQQHFAYWHSKLWC